MAERNAEPDEKKPTDAAVSASASNDPHAVVAKTSRRGKNAASAIEPNDPLAPALAAVDRGDLVEAKRLARELTTGEDVDAALKSRAENLLAQLAPDRVTIAVMVASGVLAIVLYLVYHH
jgi:hypothetical protein